MAWWCAGMVVAMRSLPTDLAAFLAEHHGVASRAELGRLCSPWRVDELVRHGALVRVERGIYRVSGSPWSFLQRTRAAILRAGPGALAGPWSSATLHDIEGLSIDVAGADAGRTWDRVLDVVVPRGVG